MYAVLPFTIFLAPPLVGFLADKMGSYTRALILTLIGSGIFHTVLLFLPKVEVVEIMPSSTLFTFEGKFDFFGKILVIDIFFFEILAHSSICLLQVLGQNYFLPSGCAYVLKTLKSMHSKCQLEF